MDSLFNSFPRRIGLRGMLALEVPGTCAIRFDFGCMSVSAARLSEITGQIMTARIKSLGKNQSMNIPASRYEGLLNLDPDWVFA